MIGDPVSPFAHLFVLRPQSSTGTNLKIKVKRILSVSVYLLHLPIYCWSFTKKKEEEGTGGKRKKTANQLSFIFTSSLIFTTTAPPQNAQNKKITSILLVL